MAYPLRTFVNVPKGSTPPNGAGRLNATFLEELEAWGIGVDGHLDDYLEAHGGLVRVVCMSTTRPASPPPAIVIHETDTGRELVNEGTAAAPVWVEHSREKLDARDLVDDYVVEGLLPAVPSPASLTATVPSGKAYITGLGIVKAALSLSFAKGRDTYVDLGASGVYAFSSVANGAAAPAIAAGDLRLFRAVTDADVAQRETVDIVTVAASTVYTVTVGGVAITYTSDAAPTEGEIALGLVAAINASTDPSVSVVTAATSALATDAAATFTITADVAGTAFTLTVDANLSRATTTANNAAKITSVTDLRDTTPTVRGASGGGATSLDGLSDVVISTPTTGQVVKYNGTEWVNAADQGGAKHTIQDEGLSLVARTNLNFVGEGVAVTDDSANDQTDVTILGGGGGSAPAVAQVSAGGTFVSIGTGVTLVKFGAVDFDPDALWDSVNSRFIPKVAGYYHAYMTNGLGNASGSIYSYRLYKNAALDGILLNDTAPSVDTSKSGEKVLYLNGTTDFVRLYATSSAGGNSFSSSVRAWFGIKLVRAG